MPETPRIWGLWILSLLISRIQQKKFKNVTHYCLFIGYPRTGHTLLNAMLNAHENIVLANELKDLFYMKKSFSKLQLFYLLERNSRLFHNVKKSFHTGYSYVIPHSWQGKHSKITIIGNKDAQYVSRMLMKDPEIVDKLNKHVGVPLKIFHVVRHPLDTIATMSIKSVLINPDKIPPTPEIIDLAIDLYFKYVDAVVAFKQKNNHEIFDLYHEDFIENPKRCFTEMLDFVGVEHTFQTIENACSIVFESPRKSRTKIEWQEYQLEKIKQHSNSVVYLKKYFETNNSL